MEGKASDWRPGPTVCRCCLSEGCYKDISTEYFWMGKREVYEEMLTETLNISISFSKSGGPNSNSRLICEPCIARLRDATEFKRQVIDCEKTFMHHLDPGSSSSRVTVQTIGDVKVELVKREKDTSDDDFDDRPDFLDVDSDDDLDNQPLTKLASKVPKKEAVDILDLLDNSQITVKRKATLKIKEAPPKKLKKKEVVVKPSASKPAPAKKPTEKKKGKHGVGTNDTLIKVEENVYLEVKPKSKYQRSARAESRIATKKNATSILQCWTLRPFRWKKNRFKCAYCEVSFTECIALRDHIKCCATQHDIDDIYTKFKEMPLINVDTTEAFCNYCSTAFIDVAQMREHVIQHGLEFDTSHPDGVLPFKLDRESWKCALCEDKFNNFLKLYEHMNTHYQHYICASCGKGYMTAPRLRKHSEVHISGTFPCVLCDKVFSMRAARDSHKATVHGKCSRYECPHCYVRFDSYYHRMTHLKDAHSVKEVLYNCAHCDLSFKTSGKRASHVRSVHFPSQRKFSCSCCGWHFKSNYELSRHMVRHTGESNFHCYICGKSYPRKRALTTHLKTHQGLNCKWCGVVIDQKNELVLHLRTVHPELTEITPMS